MPLSLGLILLDLSLFSGVNNRDMLILDLASDNSPEFPRTGIKALFLLSFPFLQSVNVIQCTNTMVSDSYFGKPFVWCLLHNGGGNRAIYGNLTLIANEPINTMNIPNITMVNH